MPHLIDHLHGSSEGGSRGEMEKNHEPRDVGRRVDRLESMSVLRNSLEDQCQMDRDHPYH